MEAVQRGFFGVSPSTLAIVLVAVVIAFFTSFTYYHGRLTVPLPSYKSGFRGSQVEGFGGAAAGTGQPNCLRSSSEAAALYAMLVPSENAEDSCVSANADNARELEQLLGKLCCLKKDLVSPSYIVDATRSLKYSTSHDIEPIAETTSRCFSKTISPRDLEIAFDKWHMRLLILVKRLATDSNSKKAEELADAVVRDVKDVARGSCLQGEPMMGGKPGPRDAHPYEPPSDSELGKFSGYY